MNLKLTATNIEVKMFPPKPGHYIVSFVTPDLAALSAFVDGRMPERSTIVISDEKKRSLDANAYMWVLLDKIAAKLYTTSKEVYREIIQDVGAWEWSMHFPEDVTTHKQTWESQGEGWVAIEYPTREVKSESGKIVKVVPFKDYRGSSTYTVTEMNRLIDEVVKVAKENGIETMTPDELEELKEKTK